MIEGRIILVPPATPGSLGDEGMIRGALELFRGREVVVLNLAPECVWLAALGIDGGAAPGVSEAPGPFRAFAEQFRADDTVVVVGADVIDSTCGLEPSFERIDLLMRALAIGLKAYVSLSFRSQVAPEILERLPLLANAVFLTRDQRSLDNFRRQVGPNCRYFPDLSFLCAASPPEAVQSTLAAIARHKASDAVLGVNFSEQSFRSFSDEHSDERRERFVDHVMSQLWAAQPNAFFVLFSNDRRGWPGHWSDDDYQRLAESWVCRNVDPSRVMLVDPSVGGYPANLACMAALDLVVTGRMHLALAAFRAGTVPVAVMGRGKGYSSVDKMRGAFELNIGSADGVVSDLESLGAISAVLLSQRVRLEARIAELAQGRNASDEREIAWLKAELRGDNPSSGDADDGRQKALTLALSNIVRLSDGPPGAPDPRRELAAKLDARDRQIAELAAKLDARDRQIAAILEGGDELVRELRQAYSRPWRPLWLGARRMGLAALLACGGLWSARARDQLRKSINERPSRQFQREWRKICGTSTDAE